MIQQDPTYQVTVDQAPNAEQPRFELVSALGLLAASRPPVMFPGMFAQLQTDVPQVSFAGIQVVEDDDERPTSHLGTPIFYPLTFKGGRYRRFGASGKVEEVNMQTLRLPITSMVEMQRGKAVTTTAAVASGGTVKEVYAMEDWTVRIAGIILDERNQPQGATTWQAMQDRLLDWYDLADAIEVEGELFARRRIYRLVLRSLQFGPVPGRPRFHSYQMEAISDEPLDLIIQ